jgi:hypothetical protein
VRLKSSAPAGCIHEQLLLVTEDAQIPLYVSGRVVPKVSVSPESLLLGKVARGKHVTRKVVLRAHEPFRVRSVTCDSDCFRFKTEDNLSKRHIVEIIFEAKDDVGDHKKTIRIETDVGGEHWAEIVANFNVIPSQK